MNHKTLWVIALSIWLVMAVGGCPDDRKPQATQNTINTPANPTAPLPENVEGLKKERDNLKARLSLVENAIEDKKNEQIQLKIWIGVGALVLAGIILVFLGVYTSRTILLSIGVGAFGLAALGVLAAALVPYIMWIGIGISLIVIAMAVYMLLNREKAIKQVSNAVDTAKKRVPAFNDAYKDIFNGHIDTHIDTLLDSIRGVNK